MQPFRIPPALPAAAMQTYQIAVPLSTHWNPVTCEQAGCEHQRLGWVTRVDESTQMGQRQAWYIRSESGRKFTEEREPSGLTAFTFEAGQQCFTQHRARNMRPERFRVLGGDWRGNPAGVPAREHTRPDDWVDDFAGNQDRIATLIGRG